ncbi:hypothetical protein PROPEN_01085 [Proteus penneri ATCC 35198]|nr:hypothetical protein PROPEN_01085 [Proteus penneri ATCC 35198]
MTEALLENDKAILRLNSKKSNFVIKTLNQLTTIVSIGHNLIIVIKTLKRKYYV